jgi:hypothetical protein
MKNGLSLAVGLAAGVASVAQAGDWGLLYEYNTGSGWTRNASIDVSSGAVNVQFRMSAYVADGTTVTTAAGTGLAIAVARFTGSNILTYFGSASAGDQVLSYSRNLANGNAALLQTSLLPGGRVLGQANSQLSFASQLLQVLPPQQVLQTVILSGTIRVGNLPNLFSNPQRKITFKNYTYGLLGVTAPGNTPGLTFYNAASNGQSGVANGVREDLVGELTVIPTPASAALIGLGGLVAARRRRA